MNRNDNEFETIDLLRVFRALRKNLLLILFVGFVCASLMFLLARHTVKASYQASIRMYAYNEASKNTEGLTTGTSDLTLSARLVDTYLAILQSRATLEAVAEQAGLPYPPETLLTMISASDVNSTGLFEVTVTAAQAEEARVLAKAVSQVLPGKISEIIQDCTVQVVDHAVTPRGTLSLSYTTYFLVGLLAGLVLSATAAVLLSFYDNIIRSEDYVLQTYDAPILAAIPDLMAHSSKKDYRSYYGAGEKGGLS